VRDDTFDGSDGIGGGWTFESARYDSRNPVVDFDLNSLFMLRFQTDCLPFRSIVGVSTTGLTRPPSSVEPPTGWLIWTGASGYVDFRYLLEEEGAGGRGPASN
jgi:hypothetical protein